jgi:hypothetical protein
MFCLNMPSGTLYKRTDVRFICCRPHRFAIKSLLCCTQCCHLDPADSDLQYSNTHTECVLVLALQQWLPELATILRYPYIPCLVCFTSWISPGASPVLRDYIIFFVLQNLFFLSVCVENLSSEYS